MALIISSGGFKGFIMLGMISKLFGKRTEFTTYSGSSIGGLIVVLLAQGLDALKIFTELASFLPQNIYSFDYSKLDNLLKSHIHDKTFTDFLTEGKHIILPVFNSETGENIYYNPIDFPNEIVRNIVIKTTMVPSFRTVDTETDFDGGIVSPVPIKFTKDYIKKNNLPNLKCTIIYSYVPIKKHFITSTFTKCYNMIINLMNNIINYEKYFIEDEDSVYEFSSPFDANVATYSDALEMFVNAIKTDF